MKSRMLWDLERRLNQLSPHHDGQRMPNARLFSYWRKKKDRALGGHMREAIVLRRESPARRRRGMKQTLRQRRVRQMGRLSTF
jgi:hypothetical protein